MAAGATLMWFAYQRRARCKSPKAGRESPFDGPSLAEELSEALGLDASEAEAELAQDLSGAFDAACAWVAKSGASLSSEAKLGFYGRYKQAVAGDCPQKKPWGMEAGMKYDAWKEHEGASSAEAMHRYVSFLTDFEPRWREGVRTERAAGPKAGNGPTTGPAVSTMRVEDGKEEDLDTSPVGQLCQHIAEGELANVRAVLRSNPQLACQMDKDGMTPLHWAADRGSLDAADLILSLAPDAPTMVKWLACRDGNGDTPLHLAVITENKEVAALFVSKGASSSVQNNDGETPLDLAESDESWTSILQ